MNTKNVIKKGSNDYYYSEQQLGIDNRTKKLVMEQVLNLIKGRNVLEFGFVDGMFTDMMLESDLNVTVVEGSYKHISYAKNKYKNSNKIKIIHDYFETFSTEHKYDTIVAGDMIQYLDDPISFFKKTINWLKKDGSLIVTTPNSRSFHRRIGTYLGLSDHPGDVSSQERAIGNVFMYDHYQLRHVLVQSGYEVNFVRGCFLKPLSSGQIDAWSDELLKAFLAIGEELGEYGWFLIAHCSLKN